jgi:hypothetical protein
MMVIDVYVGQMLVYAKVEGLYVEMGNGQNVKEGWGQKISKYVVTILMMTAMVKQMKIACHGFLSSSLVRACFSWV